MKKVVIIIICLIVIISSSTIGYVAVSANTQVEIEENIIDNQNKLQENFKSYGYTIDNPSVIVNPYEISPLTALIIFETEAEEEVTVTIKGKTSETTYTNKFEKSNIHYIPIYGLYPDYTNKIIIKYKNIEKEIEIKTDKLQENISNNIQNNTNKLLFITTNNYTYAIDQNNDIRWYLTKEYLGKISRLSNGHFLLSSDKKIENNYSTGLVEIDLLGKIYKEYQIQDGYYGSYTELDDTLLVLSKELLEIDKQTGAIINKIELSDTYNTVNIQNNLISLTNNFIKTKINKDTKEETTTNINEEVNESQTSLDFYNTDKNYKLETGVSFNIKTETQTSKEDIFLINYKSPDENYDKYNITLKQETDRLVVSGEFNTSDKVYIILEKFLEKKVYDVEIEENITYKYINSKGLDGKYSIYIKINDKLYKTNNYINF